MLVTASKHCSRVSVVFSFSLLLFLTCFLTCYPVSILICLRLNLSTVHNVSSIILCNISFSYHSCHSPFCSIMEKVLVPENMPKPSMLPVPNHFLLVSLPYTNTSLFVTFSVQLIFSILRHIHISNASNSFTCFS